MFACSFFAVVTVAYSAEEGEAGHVFAAEDGKSEALLNVEFEKRVADAVSGGVPFAPGKCESCID